MIKNSIIFFIDINNRNYNYLYKYKIKYNIFCEDITNIKEFSKLFTKVFKNSKDSEFSNHSYYENYECISYLFENQLLYKKYSKIYTNINKKPIGFILAKKNKKNILHIKFFGVLIKGAYIIDIFYDYLKILKNNNILKIKVIIDEKNFEMIKIIKKLGFMKFCKIKEEV